MVRLKVGHIDSAPKMIRIEQSKGRKDRNVMLSADTLESVATMVEGLSPPAPNRGKVTNTASQIVRCTGMYHVKNETHGTSRRLGTHQFAPCLILDGRVHKESDTGRRWHQLME